MRRQTLDSIGISNQAFALWNKGHSLRDIGVLLDVPTSTVSKWKELGNWEERAVRIMGSVNDDIDTLIEETKREQVSKMNGMIQQIFDAFEEAESGTKLELAKALSEIVRVQRLMSGEATSITRTNSVREDYDIATLAKIFQDTRGNMDLEQEEVGLINDRSEEILNELDGQGIALEEEVPSDLLEERVLRWEPSVSGIRVGTTEEDEEEELPI